jgi:hypothetical protein
MTIYKATQKINIYYVLGFVVLLTIIIPLSSRFSSDSWPVLIVFLLLFLAYSLFTYRLSEIHLDRSDGLALFYKNHIGIKKASKYDLSGIEFTYKKQATSLRSGIKDVCTIYNSAKKIIQIIPDDDDWDEAEIDRLVRGLIAAGIKRKFTGYGLKDVEV